MINVFKVHKKIIGYSIACLLGTYTFMIAFVNIIMHTIKPDTYGLIAGGVAFIISVFFVLGMAVNQYSNSYNEAVTFGVTRRKYLLSISALNIINILLMIAVVQLIGLVDNMIYQQFYGNIVVEVDFLAHIKIWHMFISYIIAQGIGLFIAALLLKFGGKILWIFWVIYFVILFVLNKIDHFMVITNIETYFIIFGIILCCCFSYGVLVLLKQEVK